MLNTKNDSGSELINNGHGTEVWGGITHARMLRACTHATVDQARAISYCAALMVAGKCTWDEFYAGRRALFEAERNLMNFKPNNLKSQ